MSDVREGRGAPCYDEYGSDMDTLLVSDGVKSQKK